MFVDSTFRAYRDMTVASLAASVFFLISGLPVSASAIF